MNVASPQYRQLASDLEISQLEAYSFDLQNLDAAYRNIPSVESIGSIAGKATFVYLSLAGVLWVSGATSSFSLSLFLNSPKLVVENCCTPEGMQFLFFSGTPALVAFLASLAFFVFSIMFLGRAVISTFYQRKKRILEERYRAIEERKRHLIRTLEKRVGDSRVAKSINISGGVNGSTIGSIGGAVTTSINLNQEELTKLLERILGEHADDKGVVVADAKDLSKRLISALLVSQIVGS